MGQVRVGLKMARPAVVDVARRGKLTAAGDEDWSGGRDSATITTHSRCRVGTRQVAVHRRQRCEPVTDATGLPFVSTWRDALHTPMLTKRAILSELTPDEFRPNLDFYESQVDDLLPGQPVSIG